MKHGGRSGRSGRRGRRVRRGSSGVAFDVKGLRAALGKPYGKPASRSMLAEMIGASEGSILNWETGKPPTEKFAALLRDLADRAKRGPVDLPARKRGGRRPGRPARASNNGAAPAARGRGGRPRKIVATGAAPVLYANHVSVDAGAVDALVRFALVLPGQAGARVVAEVMIPRDELPRLRV